MVAMRYMYFLPSFVRAFFGDFSPGLLKWDRGKVKACDGPPILTSS